MKIQIFDEKKSLKLIKIIALVFLGILFIWFTFNITGLKIGQTKIVTSAFVDEPIDFIFWLIYLLAIIVFIFKDKLGKYIVAIVLLAWACIQYSMFFKSKEGIKSYNNFFSDTHRIIPALDNFLIKDTYHIFLDIFILFALISVIIFIITKLRAVKERS